jgi:hypothetical protein
MLNAQRPGHAYRLIFPPLPVKTRTDPFTDWLDKAVRIVEKQIQEMNRKQRGKEQSEMSVVRS